MEFYFLLNCMGAFILLADPGLNVRGHIPSVHSLLSLFCHLFPYPLSPPLPFSSFPPLKSRTPSIAAGGMGERLSSPVGPGSRQTYFGAF